MTWYRIPHTDQRMWLNGKRTDLELIEDEMPVAEPAVEESDEADGV